jgi:nucleoside diphosphate kinase
LRAILDRLTSDPDKRGYYARDEDFQQGLHAFGDLGLDVDRLASELSVAILTPGCLIAGKANTAVGILAEAGFQAVYARAMLFDEEQIRRVWRYQLNTFAADRWKLIIELLTCGPSILLILRTGAPMNSASRKLKELKGPSDPLLATSAHLRRRLGGMNKIVNLVHTSEDAADAMRETAILLSDRDFRCAWKDALTKPSPIEFRNFASVLDNGRWSAASFVHVAAALRWRTVTALRLIFDHTACDDLVEGLTAELRFVEERSVDRPIEALTEYRRVFRSLVPMLDSLGVDGDYLAEIRVSVLQQLDAALHMRECELDGLWAACEAADIFVDRWEKLVISTEVITTSLREDTEYDFDEGARTT